jgi:hypothetical protein
MKFAVLRKFAAFPDFPGFSEKFAEKLQIFSSEGDLTLLPTHQRV